MPRVSVIVPAHNSAAVLPDALRSIEAQTFTDWEVIVADDASSDGTQAVAEAFGPRARVVRSETNLGPAGARNLALSQAGGELVALLDADDQWLPQYLERQVGRFDAEHAAGRRVGVVACDAALAGPDGVPRSGTFLDHFRGEIEPLTLAQVLKGNPIFISALVRREAGEAVDWFATELFGTEDHDLWIRILEQGWTAVLNREVLAVYRQAPGSVSSNLARMGSYNQRTYERALARGRLSARERRIARSELRYNRALAGVAAAWFDGERRRLATLLPTLAVVALTHPRSWGDWARVLAAR